jgi:hypothetical protein
VSRSGSNSLDEGDYLNYCSDMSETLRSIPATVEPDGTVRLSQAVHLDHQARAVVTIMIENGDHDLAQLSDKALGKDWNRPEEDQAWGVFQEDK